MKARAYGDACVRMCVCVFVRAYSYLIQVHSTWGLRKARRGRVGLRAALAIYNKIALTIYMRFITAERLESSPWRVSARLSALMRYTMTTAMRLFVNATAYS